MVNTLFNLIQPLEDLKRRRMWSATWALAFLILGLLIAFALSVLLANMTLMTISRFFGSDDSDRVTLIGLAIGALIHFNGTLGAWLLHDRRHCAVGWTLLLAGSAIPLLIIATIRGIGMATEQTSPAIALLLSYAACLLEFSLPIGLG